MLQSLLSSPLTLLSSPEANPAGQCPICARNRELKPPLHRDLDPSSQRLSTRPSTPSELHSELYSWLQSVSQKFRQRVQQTIQEVPLTDDFTIIFERDPAARHWLEVLLCYPGLHAIASHRLANWLYHRRLPFFPRFISHLARFCTGIEIHPGATLGKGVFIDHGMGVVIGETAIVGDYTLIYQGVTLGGTGKETGKRHPTVGTHVVIGAGAKVLGNIHIGDQARIGAGSIVLNHVPSNCTAVGVPGRNICRSNAPACPLDHDQLPDAQAAVTRELLDRIEELEKQVRFLMSI